jgi:hypothetical protein
LTLVIPSPVVNILQLIVPMIVFALMTIAMILLDVTILLLFVLTIMHVQKTLVMKN